MTNALLLTTIEQKLADQRAGLIRLGPAQLQVEADSLTLTLGLSSIRLTPEGITLSAPRIDLNPDDA